MDALKMANAIVHFRMLRSVGGFHPTREPGVYQFYPCSCGRATGEPIPNGLPEPVSRVKVKEIIDHFTRELGMLCRQHYR